MVLLTEKENKLLIIRVDDAGTAKQRIPKSYSPQLFSMHWVRFHFELSDFSDFLSTLGRPAP